MRPPDSPGTGAGIGGRACRTRGRSGIPPRFDLGSEPGPGSLPRPRHVVGLRIDQEIKKTLPVSAQSGFVFACRVSLETQAADRVRAPVAFRLGPGSVDNEES